MIYRYYPPHDWLAILAANLAKAKRDEHPVPEPIVITLTPSMETVTVPYYDNSAFVRPIDLSELAKAVQAIRGDSEDVTDVIHKVTNYDLTEAPCPTCMVDRPTIEKDGQQVCVYCKAVCEREYDVTMLVTFTTTTQVMASSEDEAWEKAKEKWNNGDVDTDFDDADIELDHVSEAW